MKFEKLVQNKKFMSTVMKITYDEHQPEELVSMDIKLKTQNGEIYLYKMLENEGICLKG